MRAMQELKNTRKWASDAYARFEHMSLTALKETFCDIAFNLGHLQDINQDEEEGVDVDR